MAAERRGLWFVLPFFSVWLTGWTFGTAALVLETLRGPSLSEVVFSALFVGGAMAGAGAVLHEARRHREAAAPASLEVDLDGMRLRWSPGLPAPIRGLWAAGLVAMPLTALLLTVAGGLAGATSALAWAYGLALAVPWLVGAHAWWRHAVDEIDALARCELEVRGGRLRLFRHHPLGADEVERWALGGISVRSEGGGLTIDTPEGARPLACRLSEEELDLVARWISEAGRTGGREPPQEPEALARLRRSVSEAR